MVLSNLVVLEVIKLRPRIASVKSVLRVSIMLILLTLPPVVRRSALY